MADVSKRYRWLERLPIEELEELLRLAVAPQPEEEDSAYIDAILEVMVKKEKEQPTGRISDVDQSWKEFQEYYRTEEGIPLHYTEAPRASQAAAPAAHPRRLRRSGLRRTLTVAAIVAVLVAMMGIPAFGYESILQMVANWTAEQFYFVTGGTPQKQAQEGDLPPVPEEYTALQEALAAQGVGQLLVLRDIPEGFELLTNDFYPFDGTSIDSYVVYQRESDYISFGVVWANEPLSGKYEKDARDVEVITVNDTDHYFFTNRKMQNVVWMSDGVEYSIGTTLPKENLLNLLNSVYEV